MKCSICGRGGDKRLAGTCFCNEHYTLFLIYLYAEYKGYDPELMMCILDKISNKVIRNVYNLTKECGASYNKVQKHVQFLNENNIIRRENKKYYVNYRGVD